jgi:hypothetical protein
MFMKSVLESILSQLPEITKHLGIEGAEEKAFIGASSYQKNHGEIEVSLGEIVLNTGYNLYFDSNGKLVRIARQIWPPWNDRIEISAVEVDLEGLWWQVGEWGKEIFYYKNI